MTSLLFRPTSSSNTGRAVDEASDFYLTLPPINHGEAGGSSMQVSRHNRHGHHQEELLAITDFDDSEERSPHLKTLEGRSKLAEYHAELLVPRETFMKGSGSDDCLSCSSNSFIGYPERSKSVSEFV